MESLEQKYNKLKNILLDMGSILAAYSGGVDSALLAKVAHDVLGDRMLAVTACSPTYPKREYRYATRLACELGINRLTIYSSELDCEEFASNPPERCYYCKQELFGKLKQLAAEKNIAWVADGSNKSDEGDFRPGMDCAREMGVRSPLREAGLTKHDIRKLSKQLGLTGWNKPASACLSSRFPYGERITKEKLKMIEQAEEYLWDMGISQVRVRHHGNTAKIEIPPNELASLLNNDIREKLIDKFKQIGYTYITLDLEGYRSGSMNEVLEKGSKTPDFS